MKEAVRYLDEFVRRLGAHPLYEWTTTAPLADPRRHYDSFIPLLGFVMTFPYYNEIYLEYRGASEPDPPALSRLKEIINEQAREDKTHVRLFLQDMRRLKLDDVWRLRSPSSLLWTIWVSPMFDDARAVLSKRVEAVVDHEDAWPAYRYLHMEQIERDGNLLFTATHALTDKVVAAHGADPVYFGEHHLVRESGHVGGDEFVDVELSDEQMARARGLIEYKHALSMKMNDAMYRFVRDAEPRPFSGDPLLIEQQESLALVRRRIDDHCAGRIETPQWNIRPDVYCQQSEIIAAWYRHHADFVSHPVSALFREAAAHEPGFALRCASLILANRISALHTFYLHDCHVDEDSGEGAEVVNFIGRLFSTEAETFFHDWDVLEIDQRVPWQPADMLEWWFHDKVYGRPEMESLHEWRRQTLRAHDPIRKYWAIMSVHIMSRAFFGCAQPLARRFAALHPEKPRLVYLENVHHLLYDRMVENFANPAHPTSLGHLPVTAAQRDDILQMMEIFARLGMRQFDNIARALTTDREKFAFFRD